MSTPKTIIKFYDIYDLLPNYEHTRYFSSENARDTYFDAHVGLTVNPTQHIRVDELEVKISKNISAIHSYTYMSIQNGKGANQYDHRYYCFITDMEYVSDLCTLVKYKIDVMQTFAMDGLFSSTMPYQSWIKRCHNLTDHIGDNIVAEPFDVENYEVNDFFVEDTLNNLRIVIGISTADEQITIEVAGTPVTIDMRPKVYYNNMYTCIHYFVFQMGDIGTGYFKGLLDYFSGSKVNEIVDFYICPSYAVPQHQYNINVSTDESSIIDVAPMFYANGRYGEPTRDTVSGYTPKNKKLFTYPYTKLTVSNGEGQVKDYAFEFFHVGAVPEFACEGSFIGEPSVTLFPKNYKIQNTTLHKATGGTRTQNYKYDDCITLTDYPKCAYNVDAYKYYQSQNGVANAIKAVGSALGAGLIGFLFGGGIGMATGMASSMASASVGAAVSGVGAMTAQTVRNVSDMTAEQIKANKSSDTTLNNVSGKYNAMEHAHKNFLFFRNCVEPQLAEQIDNYFTRFGYAQNKLMNIGQYLNSNTRPYFAFVQTSGFSVLNGGFEQKYKLQLQEIMDKGITFWFSTSVAMGNYSLDNTPSSS